MFGIDLGITADSMDVFSALWGMHGAGKTSLMTVLATDALKRSPWRPIISAVPVSTLKPKTLFLINNPGDLLAASLVLAAWVYSPQAAAIHRAFLPHVQAQERLTRFARRGTVAPNFFHDGNALQVFEVLQEDYRETAKRFTERGVWKDKKVINSLLMGFNHLVLTNRLGQNVGDVHKLAEIYMEADRFALADHCHGDFRFQHRAPAFRVMCLFDEIGVTFGADDNKDLKESAMYPWLTHARRLGAQVLATGHDASRAWVQMRQVFSTHYRVKSWAFSWGRAWMVTGYKTLENLEARKDNLGHKLCWASWDDISRGTSLYNILAWN